MSCPDLSILEEAISIVNSWEASYSERLLTASEAGSLIQAIAHQLQVIADGRLEADCNRDFLRDAYAIIVAWNRERGYPRLNAAQAAMLAGSIEQAFEKTLHVRRAHSRLITPASAHARTHAEQTA